MKIHKYLPFTKEGFHRVIILKLLYLPLEGKIIRHKVGIFDLNRFELKRSKITFNTLHTKILYLFYKHKVLATL